MHFVFHFIRLFICLHSPLQTKISSIYYDDFQTHTVTSFFGIADFVDFFVFENRTFFIEKAITFCKKEGEIFHNFNGKNG